VTPDGHETSNEHRPIHVHVRYGGGEAVFEVEQRVELRESQVLKVRELAQGRGGNWSDRRFAAVSHRRLRATPLVATRAAAKGGRQDPLPEGLG
jgi:hypothetical protein